MSLKNLPFPTRFRRQPSPILLIALALAGALPAVLAQIVTYIPDFHPRFKLIATVPGEILDANADAILYNNGVVSLLNLNTGTTTAIHTNRLYRPNGFITPAGVLLFADQAQQIDGSEQVSLGIYSSWFPDWPMHTVDGPFGIFRTPDGLLLRDFAARTNAIIHQNPGCAAVAHNGSVVFTVALDETNKAIRWFHQGETKTLNVFPSYATPYVDTDGTNVLWSQPRSPASLPLGSLHLQTLQGTIILSTNVFLASSPPMQSTAPRLIPLAMKNGWLVFPQWNTDTPGRPGNNLWRRAPDGSISQITTSPAFVLAMRSDGGVLIADDNISYVSPNGSKKHISPDFPLARYFAVGDKFYSYSPLPGYAYGFGLYEVEVEQDPFGFTDPTYDPQTGRFSSYLLPGAPATYELQYSSDFVTWAPITTVTATDANSVQTEVSTPPGFFRLQKL